MKEKSWKKRTFFFPPPFLNQLFNVLRILHEHMDNLESMLIIFNEKTALMYKAGLALLMFFSRFYVHLMLFLERRSPWWRRRGSGQQAVHRVFRSGWWPRRRLLVLWKLWIWKCENVEDYRSDEMSMQNAAGESCSLASAARYFCYYANLMHIYLKEKKQQQKSVSVWVCTLCDSMGGKKRVNLLKSQTTSALCCLPVKSEKKKHRTICQFVLAMLKFAPWGNKTSCWLFLLSVLVFDLLYSEFKNISWTFVFLVGQKHLRNFLIFQIKCRMKLTFTV